MGSYSPNSLCIPDSVFASSTSTSPRISAFSYTMPAVPVVRPNFVFASKKHPNTSYVGTLKKTIESKSGCADHHGASREITNLEENKNHHTNPLVGAIEIWETLRATCLDNGYTIWNGTRNYELYPPVYPEKMPIANGFSYEPRARTIANAGTGIIGQAIGVEINNALSWPATSRDGYAVLIRVILWPENHTLPLLAEFLLEDIIFGVFPKVGGTAMYAFDLWPENSVGDVLEMLMQMLEALEFTHAMKIAHRDVFLDNFLVQWHPESLLTMKISPSRPRVYLIDFEAAIEFPSEYTEE
ncbi:hypothetical protein D9613_006221 [Agrocybe pediades]|uniref:Protein kinase domain-containing protein n=1 Tax=Agrocybe pediades TaxID=84607 RepID=A0A8H4QVJ1_9AGAR|nr:hypothetical protein D9613_006221 [Agrocybe pediades]